MPEHTIRVYGQSDDLIEVEGDVREEFYANFNEPTHLLVGNTEVVVTYAGTWILEAISVATKDDVSWYSAGRDNVVERANDYTEMIEIETDRAEAHKME